jgi:ribosomal protein S18 acetylase RimI-like enzyme
MILGADLRVRPAVLTDQRQITNLIHFSSQVHRHLDWRNPLDWIGSPPFLVLESHGQVVAALGCPPDPPYVYWIRLFANSGKIPVGEAWHLLWDKVQSELARLEQYISAAIVMQDWTRDLLINSGFASHQSIIMLERDGGIPTGVAAPSGVSIRAMMAFDLRAVAEVDASAFELLWQNALPTLERAYPQAAWATVAEIDGQVVGYQLSTRNALGVHLARLAVKPGLQGKGLGYELVAHLIQKAGQHGISHLTVNTQSDNMTSLALYQRMGFRKTGENYPVYQVQSLHEGQSEK